MWDRGVVVIADDDEGVREFLRVVFSKVPCRFLEAKNGREAIELVEKEGERVVLVMLDAIMPGMGGVEALPEVVEKAPRAWVILFSGNPEPHRKKALSLGAHWVLSKPFDVRVLRKLQDIVRGGSKGKSFSF